MAKKVYLGVSNVARNVKAMYVGVGGVARKITKGYIGVGEVAKLFYSSEYTWAKYSSIYRYGAYIESGPTSTTITTYASNSSERYVQQLTYKSVGGPYLYFTSDDIYPYVYKTGSVNFTSHGLEVGKMYCSKYSSVLGLNKLSNMPDLGGTGTSPERYFIKIDSITSSKITGTYYYGQVKAAQSEYIKGDFIEYVTSTDPNAYPDDGRSGSYWYVKQS